MGKKVRSDFYLVTDRHAKKYFFILQKHELLKQLSKVWICWPLLPTDYWRWAKYMGNYSLLGRCLAWAKAPIFIGVGQKVGHLSLSYLSHTCSRPTSLAVCIQTLQTMQGTEQFSVRNVIKELLLLVDKNTGKIHFLSTLISSSFFVHAFTFPRSAPCNLSSTHAFPRTPFWYTAMRLVILTHSYTSSACNMWRKGIVIYYCLIIYFITLFIVYLLHLKLDTPRNAYLSTHIHAHPYASTYIFHWIWNNTY